jgi:hypothetical protein
MRRALLVMAAAALMAAMLAMTAPAGFAKQQCDTSPSGPFSCTGGSGGPNTSSAALFHPDPGPGGGGGQFSGDSISNTESVKGGFGGPGGGAGGNCQVTPTGVTGHGKLCTV